MDINNKRNIVSIEDVETQIFPWGRLSWLSEPRVTGTDNMTAGIVVLEQGKGHDRHNHPGCEEILFVLEGEGEQTIEENGEIEKKVVKKWDLIKISEGVYHSTINTGNSSMVLLAVYQFPGPEAQLRNSPDCKIEPPKNKN